MKSGNLNFLEPSGPLRACNGTALSLLFIDAIKVIKYLKLLPTCFGSQRTHHQGALYIAWLKITVILVIFSQALYKAPWWWIFYDPKHVGSTSKYFIILIVSKNYILCISWIIKCNWCMVQTRRSSDGVLNFYVGNLHRSKEIEF